MGDTINSDRDRQLMSGIRQLVLKYAGEHAGNGTGPRCLVEWSDGERVAVPVTWHLACDLADITGLHALFVDNDGTVLRRHGRKR